MQRIHLAVKQLLEASISAANSPLAWIKRVYLGDPINVPLASQPCIIVRPIASQYIPRGSRYDQKEETLQIILLYNQRDYYESRRGAGVNISGITRTGSVATVTTATNHGLEVGQDITINGVTPSGYNWTYLVASTPSNTTFTYSKPVNPWTYESGGVVYFEDIETVHAVREAMQRVEDINADWETNINSICGTIQHNMALPYNDGSATRETAAHARVTNVNYEFSSARGFPSFEVIVTVQATIIWDR